jgi:hypothetical protein
MCQQRKEETKERRAFICHPANYYINFSGTLDHKALNEIKSNISFLANTSEQICSLK